MRVGIYYGMDLGAGPGPDEGMYLEIAEQVRAADRAGVDTAWIGETHAREGGCPSPQVVLPALGGVTQAIRLGALKVLPLDRQPMRIAEDFAQIDVQLNGRLNFGVWEGSDAEAFSAYGQDFNQRRERFEEVLDFILVAWTNDAIAYVGEHVTFPGNAVKPMDGSRWERAPFTPPYRPQWEWGDWVPPHLAVTPKPVQTPRPPVYVYGWSDAAIDFAARCGHSFLFSPLESGARLRQKIGRYTRQLVAAGRSPSEVDVAVIRDVWVHEDPATARAQVAPVIEGAFRQAHGDGSLAEAEGRRFAAAEIAYDSLADDRFMVGDAQTVVDALKALQADTGANHVVCRMPFPGVTHAEALDFIGTFERHVHPMLLA
ncbi:MAG: LLM class flavin-dependent oxidoreductase [Dehalococcoidia bacterium]|nr:LLM class flavin-dependent oxidoreductase [Dehalococcoidia bacterium]